MSTDKKTQFEVILQIASLEADTATLTEDETEIVLPRKYLAKSVSVGERVVLTVESESEASARKTRSAKDILNEILKP